MLRLLISDESESVRETADRILSELGFAVTGCANALDAMAKCDSALPDVIIVDSNLDGALDLIANIRLMQAGKSIRILYGVETADLRKLMAAKRAGADDFLLKPFEAKVLHALFDEMLGKSAAA
ncbi:MAG: response regulator receiver protein [Rhizobium sp.]|nr:response regulator receiver protein [Rhizobium sp.]